MKRIDVIHLKIPCYGSRRIGDELEVEDSYINRKKVQCLMQLMGIMALFTLLLLLIGLAVKYYPIVWMRLFVSGHLQKLYSVHGWNQQGKDLDREVTEAIYPLHF